MTETVHATCIALPRPEGPRGVLLLGPSGSGKSDLALRLLDRGALLVSDDYSDLADLDGRLIATAPPRIAGLLEVRGIGIIPHEATDEAEVGLALDLAAAPERMPEPGGTLRFAGLSVPRIALAPFETSAALKVELAVTLFWRSAR